MPLTFEGIEHAHKEGHTDVLYSKDNENYIVTCGRDGIVKLWNKMTLKSLKNIKLDSQATALTVQEKKVYVTLDKRVETFNYDEFTDPALFTRFASSGTSLTSKLHSEFVISGANDGQINVVNAITRVGGFRLNTDNRSPILGLSLSPQNYLAASCGDGNIRIWRLSDRSLVHVWVDVFKRADSFFNAEILNVPAFDPCNGKYIAFPKGNHVEIYQSQTWEHEYQLHSEEIESDFNICKFSPCGQYIAASSTKGELIVWDVATQNLIGHSEHPSDANITSFSWDQNAIYFGDVYGRLGVFKIVFSKQKNINGLEKLKLNYYNAGILLISLNKQMLEIGSQFANIAVEPEDQVRRKKARELLKTVWDKANQTHVKIEQQFTSVFRTDQVETLQSTLSSYHTENRKTLDLIYVLESENE